MPDIEQQPTCPCCGRPVEDGTDAFARARQWKRICTVFILAAFLWALIGVVIVFFLGWAQPSILLFTNALLLSAPFLVVLGLPSPKR